MTAFCDWLAAHGSSCLELFGVVLGVITVYLSTIENIWSWPTGLLNAGAFAVVFFRTGLYSDAGLQVIYFILSLYGWYEWLYGGTGHTELHVSRTPAKQWPILVAIGVIGWLVLATITSRLPGAALPYADAALVSSSLIAQYMLTRKYIENWLLWIVINVFYIGMLIIKGLRLTAFNYAIYLVLAVLGYLSWRRSERAQALSADAAPA
jgi:nicotinamide mononucleotide transporter